MILIWESLLSVHTVAQLKEWVHQALLPVTGSSSVVLAGGISKPFLRMQPIVHTQFFPKSLISNFHGRGAMYVAPLLNESLEQKKCVSLSLDGSECVGRADDLWPGSLRAQKFSQVFVCCSATEVSQFCYVCLTDPNGVSADVVSRWLPIFCLYLRDILTQQNYWSQLIRPHVTEQMLNARETEILRWVGRGKTNQEIASILDMSFTSVKNAVQRIIAKLNVSNRAQAVSKFYSEYGVESREDDIRLHAQSCCEQVPMYPSPFGDNSR